MIRTLRTASSALLTAAGFLACLATLTTSTSAQVQGVAKLSETSGGAIFSLDDLDFLGSDVDGIGDLDNDGVTDLVAGAPRDDDGGTDTGAIWVFLMKTDGTAKLASHISDSVGGFSGAIDKNDYFGNAVAGIGDITGDGNEDIIVGAYGDDDGGTDTGAIWVVKMGTNALSNGYVKISDTTGGFTGAVADGDGFGSSVANLGDLDGDGVNDIAVGAIGDDDGGQQRGAVWILFMNSGGTVKSYSLISSTSGPGLPLNDYDAFGQDVEAIGDLDGDGNTELAVSALRDDDAGVDTGAVYVLFLDSAGGVKSWVKWDASTLGLPCLPSDYCFFGSGLGSPGDADQDGVFDLVVGASADDEAGSASGAIYFVYLNTDGTPKSAVKYTNLVAPFQGLLDNGDFFGMGVGGMADYNGDGREDLLVGVPGDDDGGLEQGALYVLNLGDGDPASIATRNGTGINRSCYTASGPAFIGSGWLANVDTAGHSGSVNTFVFAYDTILSPGLVTAFGELLVGTEAVGGTLIALSTAPPIFGTAFHVVNVPDDETLSGLPLFTQALIVSPGSIELCNALDLVLGY